MSCDAACVAESTGDRRMQTSAGLQDHILRTIVRPWAEIVGADLAGKAQREAPVKDGFLRGSITHEVVETHAPLGVEIEVTASIIYARYQHEAGDTGHDFNHPLGGKWHYLSDPLKMNAERYRATLQQVIDNGRMPPGFGAQG